MLHRYRFYALTSGSLAALWWAVSSYSGSDTKQQAAASVDKVVKEDSLNTITLTEKAENNLGITFAPITLEQVRRTRIYGGEIITPVGSRGVVTAPFGGIVKAPAQGIPKAGDTVTKGQAIVVLLPLVTAEARSASATAQLDADMQVKNATTQVEAAKTALERAKKLFADGVGAKRAVEETQAAYDIAAKTLEAAKARQHVLEDSLSEGTAEPVTITASEDGILRKVTAAHGQNVPGGTSLFEIGDATTAWVRVTLPVGDLEDIAREAQAQVGSLSARANSPMLAAQPVAAPPIANAQAFTLDLLYMLHDPATAPVPGQRVSVMLPLNDSKESLIVPSGAVVFDTLGGSWVYEQTAAHAYARRRVTVSYIAADKAVLAAGPAAGTQVLITGAQALFGAETGMLK